MRTLWSNWCEFKRHQGVEFGEYSLRQYRYGKEYYRYFMKEMEEEKRMITGLAAGIFWALDTVILGIALAMTPFVSTEQAVFLAPFVAPLSMISVPGSGCCFTWEFAVSIKM